MAWLKAHYRPLMSTEALDSWLGHFTGGLVGTPEQIVERLTKAAQAGVGYVIAYFADAAYDRTSMDLFAREVIPALQG
jgi:alkanesulfonate monooxygenase SsuD/methylene tetrahydromethanopterin reductase-like flavin-dependent oxidoreductase (luciferase family)